LFSVSTPQLFAECIIPTPCALHECVRIFGKFWRSRGAKYPKHASVDSRSGRFLWLVITPLWGLAKHRWKWH